MYCDTLLQMLVGGVNFMYVTILFAEAFCLSVQSTQRIAHSALLTAHQLPQSLQELQCFSQLVVYIHCLVLSVASAHASINNTTGRPIDADQLLDTAPVAAELSEAPMLQPDLIARSLPQSCVSVLLL